MRHKHTTEYMKTIDSCKPRQAVLDGTADFVVNLADLTSISKAEATEFLDSNVLTSGMQILIENAFSRLGGNASASGIYKLSESMGGGKTQSMLVSGILARFPNLSGTLPFDQPLPKVKMDVVASFTGRSTDKKVWVDLGKQIGVKFPDDRAPSETEWRDALKGKTALILLDELAFYLVHAASMGSPEEGQRASTLASIAMTNLFGAVRDYKECRNCVIIIADLEKDWEQGAEELNRLLNQNAVLSGTVQSVNNEMSKGAQTITPVDNQKDELYSILRKRIFQNIDATDAEIEEVADAYVKQLKKASAIIDRPVQQIREEILASYPFHFSTKHLIGTFNDNPGFQKTRDVIRLMATVVREIWSKSADPAVRKRHLLSLADANLNAQEVSSRFIAIKPSLREAVQTDIASNGTSFAESFIKETKGMSYDVARWIYTASLSEVRPQGLKDSEIAEYLSAPGVDIGGLQDTLKRLGETCWYIEQTKGGSYFFNRQRNLNAQLNAYIKSCAKPDTDQEVENKLKQMFEPRDKSCYQKAAILPALDSVKLDRDKTTLVVCRDESDFATWYSNEKYKNRVVFLIPVDNEALFHMNKKAQRRWAIRQIVADLTPEDSQYQKAKALELEIDSELFLSARSLFAKVHYPLIDQATQDTTLVATDLLDSYHDDSSGNLIKFRPDDAGKGEFVIEATLRDASKFMVFQVAGQDPVKALAPLRKRVETFLFGGSNRTAWEQIMDGAASRGHMVLTQPGTLERMKDALLRAGEWREEAGQILKPPFDEVTSVSVEWKRDDSTGQITTTDLKIAHADKLMVQEDGGEWREIPLDKPLTSDAMRLAFKAVDSSNKNKDGATQQVENYIDLSHEFLDSPTEGNIVIKIRTVPDCPVKCTDNGADPANSGSPYVPPGLDVPEGTTIRLYAECKGVTKEARFVVPKSGKGGEDEGVSLDLTKPVDVAGRGLKFITRQDTYKFLSTLPDTATLRMVAAKVTDNNVNQNVSLRWDRTSTLTAKRILQGFDYLDSELPQGEWSLQFDTLHFENGSSLNQWQVDSSQQIDPTLISQPS